MASCEDCIHNDVCDYRGPERYATIQDMKNDCAHCIPTADVVPKSEVEKLQEAYNNRLAKDIQTNADFVRYAQDEVALEVIEEASEFVSIYAEEAKNLADNEEHSLAKSEFRGNQIGALIILNFLAKLKKKYTEDQT